MSVISKANRTVRIATAVLGLAAVASFVGVVAEPAGAMSAPIHITSTVNIRPGPSTASGNPLGTIPTGGSPDFHCWTQGQNIYGVDVWFNVTWSGITGYYASYYDDSSYATDAQITSKYGIPQCGQPVSGPNGTETAAMNWAKSKVGTSLDSGLCLKFVFDAYSASGVNLRPYVNVAIGSNTYPVDIWGHFNHGSTGGGTPPAGALVFFASKTGNRTLSHVTLSVGGGNMVSTTDSVNGSVVHYETLAQHSYAIELGWWLPV